MARQLGKLSAGRFAITAITIAMAVALVPSNAFAIKLTDTKPVELTELLYGSNANDTLHSNAFDQMFGKSGDDKLIGDHGVEFLMGGPGKDLLKSGPKQGDPTSVSNTVIDDDGTPGDVLKGTNHNSDLFISADGAKDTIKCLGGIIDGVPRDVDYVIADPQDVVSDCEAVYTTTTGSIVIGTNANETIDAPDGSSTVVGGRGDDTLTNPGGGFLFGGAGKDSLFGGGNMIDDDGGPGDFLDMTAAGLIRSADGAPDIIVCGPGAQAVFADPEDQLFGSCEQVYRGDSEMFAWEGSQGPLPGTPGDGRLGAKGTGTFKETACPIDKAVIGFVGTEVQGGAVEYVKAACEAGALPSDSIGSDAQPADGSTTCPAGQVAVGIEGNESIRVNELAVRCQASTLSGPITAASPLGSRTDGTTDGPIDCPAGTRLSGLMGSTDAGHVPQDVQLVCNKDASQIGDVASPDARSTVCFDGDPVLGITGRSGTTVQSIRVTCDGDEVPASIGDGSGASGSTCGLNEVAVGIAGKERGAGAIDSLAVRCQDASLTGPVTTKAAYGGAGGTSAGPFDCPAGQRLIGLQGSQVLFNPPNDVLNVEPLCAAPSTIDAFPIVTAKAATIHGTVTPTTGQVSVSFQQEDAGTFQTLASQTVDLDNTGAYSAKFKRATGGGQCRAIATYLGTGTTSRHTKTIEFPC